MAAGYSKEFLIDAFLSRYDSVMNDEERIRHRALAEKLYDEVGKDRFRVYASLDAAAIKDYKAKS